MKTLRRNVLKQLLETSSKSIAPRAQSYVIESLALETPCDVSSSAPSSSTSPAVRPIDPRTAEGNEALLFEPRRRGFSTAASQAAVLRTCQAPKLPRHTDRRGQHESAEGNPALGRPINSAAAREYTDESADESSGEPESRWQPNRDAEADSESSSEPSKSPRHGEVPVLKRKGFWSPNHSLTKALTHAETLSEVVRLCEGNLERLNIFHATAAIHRLGKLIGIRRSEATPILLHDRQLHYYNRERLLQSEVFRQLQNVVVQDKRRASKEMLCLILWGLARLRANPNVPPTPPVAVETAKELERRLHLHAPYEGSQLPLSQACWALSQIMRKDAPWGDLLRLIGQSLRSSQPALDPGPASTVLKATAIYQVVHGVNPMPGEILDFLAEGLLQPEHHSPGPQAISQGLYSLAKLGHSPGRGLLQTLCLVLPTRVTGTTIDRQAVGNSMWAMATLGFVPSPMLYRQLMQLVLLHCNHFLPHHYSQVFTALRKWDHMPDPHIMQAICKGLMHSLPVIPEPSNRVRWRQVGQQLEEISKFYNKADVPLLQKSLDMVQQVVQETSPTFQEEMAMESMVWGTQPAGSDANAAEEREFSNLGAEEGYHDFKFRS